MLIGLHFFFYLTFYPMLIATGTKSEVNDWEVCKLGCWQLWTVGWVSNLNLDTDFYILIFIYIWFLAEMEHFGNYLVPGSLRISCSLQTCNVDNNRANATLGSEDLMKRKVKFGILPTSFGKSFLSLFNFLPSLLDDIEVRTFWRRRWKHSVTIYLFLLSLHRSS